MALLHAFGSIAAVLADPDEEFLRLCRVVSERILGAYIHMWPKSWKPVHSGLARLLGALESQPCALQSLLPHLVDAALECTLAPPNPDITTGDSLPCEFQLQGHLLRAAVKARWCTQALTAR